MKKYTAIQLHTAV